MVFGGIFDFIFGGKAEENGEKETAKEEKKDRMNGEQNEETVENGAEKVEHMDTADPALESEWILVEDKPTEKRESKSPAQSEQVAKSAETKLRRSKRAGGRKSNSTAAPRSTVVKSTEILLGLPVAENGTAKIARPGLKVNKKQLKRSFMTAQSKTNVKNRKDKMKGPTFAGRNNDRKLQYY